MAASLGKKITRFCQEVARKKGTDSKKPVKAFQSRTGRRKAQDRAMHYCVSGLLKIEAAELRQWLEARRAKLEQCNIDPHKQNEELEKCKADFLYWLDWYGWTYDPRLDQKTVPFIAFEAQREYARYLDGLVRDNEQGVVDKSRDMGASWLTIAYFVWRWLFEEGFAGLFASRKVGLVDTKGNLTSLMEKARFMIRPLPSWMLPHGWDEKKHSIKLKIQNPSNGAILFGEGGTQIGRGDRATMVLIDEAAFLPDPGSADAALSETADVKIFLSTPNAPGDNFAQKRFSGDYRVFSLHWLRDPRKNVWVAWNLEGDVVESGRGALPPVLPDGSVKITYAWYERAKKKLADPVKLAREIDIDYSAATDGVTIPAVWVRAAVEIPLEPNGIKWATVDLSGQGANKTVFTYGIGSLVVVQKVVDEKNPTLEARAILRMATKLGVTVLHYDAGGGYGGALDGEYHSGADAPYQFRLNAVNNGKTASKRRFGEDGRRARELFTNVRTECYWSLRLRFQKTYELWLFRQGDEDGIEHPDDECISIPRGAELQGELSQVLYEELNGGKTQLIPKKIMKEKFSMKSPDFADSLAMMEAPETPASQSVGTVVGR